MYFDTCYIAKFYFNEPDSGEVRELVRKAEAAIHSSAWALAEFHGVIHRRRREGIVDASGARRISERFDAYIEAGLWNLIPLNEGLLRRTGAAMLSAPPDLFLRTADAVHLTAAQEAGEDEVWTSDRHMLAAAGYFGLKGRSVRGPTRP